MIARPAVALVLAGTLGLGLGGCAADAQRSTFEPTAASQLQSAVLAVTEASSEGDLAAAAGELDELEAAAIAAYARGDMSDTRFDAIMVAIGLVRNDLQAALAASAEQTPEPVAPVNPEAPSSDSGATGGDGTEGAGTSSGSTDPAPPDQDSSNGRGNPGVPGPPDDKGKKD